MRISGADTIPFPVATVWDALLDPRVLVATIPGCERLEETSSNTYAMTVTAGVAAIKGTYSGSCALSDLAQHQSLVMRLQGAGAPGTIDATVDVSFAEVERGSTLISYEADAVVGGMVGGVGQRMLTSVSKRMAKEFFANIGAAIAGSAGTPERDTSRDERGRTPLLEGQPLPESRVFTAPARSGHATGSINDGGDFLKGIAVGAGLVLLGVIAGSVLPSRRTQNARRR
jgi:carbon monoxide dehydrogenase subunit G